MNTLVTQDAATDALLILNDLDLEVSDEVAMVTRILEGFSETQAKVLAVRLDALASLVDDLVYTRNGKTMRPCLTDCVCVDHPSSMPCETP